MSPMVRRPPGMELALLGFLLQEPQHGYQLHQLISDPAGLGLIWHLKQSQLYALLSKLEVDECVVSTLQNQDPHPPRKVFALTEAGRSIFSEWLISPVTAPRLVRQEFFAKLYFAKKENMDVERKLLEAQQEVCQNWVEEFQLKFDACEWGTYSWAMYQYRLGQVRALKDWLDAYERALE